MGLENLTGKTIDHRYVVIELEINTGKHTLYRVRDMNLDTVGMLKILNDGYEERTEHFIAGTEKGVKMGVDPGLPVVLSRGRINGRPFEIIEHIPGKSLKKIIDKKEGFPRRHLGELLKGLAKTANTLYKRGYHHGDIKPGNILVKRGNQNLEVFVVDYEGKMNGNKKTNGDVKAIGEIMHEASGGKIPFTLRKIMNGIKRGRYENPGQLFDSITRNERFYKHLASNVGAIVIGMATVGSGLGLLFHEPLRRTFFPSELERLVDEAKEYEELPPEIGAKLREQLHRGKVAAILNNIPLGKKPFATVGRELYMSEEPTCWDGWWAGIAIENAEVVNTPQSWAEARQTVAEIRIDPKDSKYTTATRFWLSHGGMYRRTGEEEYRDTFTRAAEILRQRFDKEKGFFPVIKNDPPKAILGTIGDVVPMYLEAYRITGDKSYLDLAQKQTNLLLRHNLNRDGSVVQEVLFDPDTNESIQKINPDGVSNEQILTRTQATAMLGLLGVYVETQDPTILEAAKKTADYYMANVPLDQLPPFDLGLPNGPKDSSAAVMAQYALERLGEITENKQYQKSARIIDRTLVDCISTDPKCPGIIMHGCMDAKKGIYEDSSLPWQNYYYLKRRD